MMMLPLIPWRPRVCTLPAGKEAGFQGLEKRNDAWFPIEDIKEEFRVMMIALVKGLLFLSSLPRSDFVEERT